MLEIESFMCLHQAQYLYYNLMKDSEQWPLTKALPNF